jgi:hypothetical protein
MLGLDPIGSMPVRPAPDLSRDLGLIDAPATSARLPAR